MRPAACRNRPSAIYNNRAGMPGPYCAKRNNGTKGAHHEQTHCVPAGREQAALRDSRDEPYRENCQLGQMITDRIPAKRAF